MTRLQWILAHNKGTLLTIGLALVALLLSGCCTTDNRKSKQAALSTAVLLEAQSAYVIDNGLIDPVKLATAADGTFDKAACIEHSKMIELFRQDAPALAAALRAWSQGEDVQDYKPEEVDHEARCSP